MTETTQTTSTELANALGARVVVFTTSPGAWRARHAGSPQPEAALPLQ